MLRQHGPALLELGAWLLALWHFVNIQLDSHVRGEAFWREDVWQQHGVVRPFQRGEYFSKRVKTVKLI